MYDPQSGRVTLDGHDVRDLTLPSLPSLRRAAAVMPQDTFLFYDTVLENVRYACPGATPDEVALALECAGATSFVAELPQGREALDFDQVARLHSIGTALHAAGLCRQWPAIFTAVSIGLRRGEVMGLTWPDVDLERGVLRIRQTRVMGLEEIETGDPKTVNSRRDVHLPPSLVAVLLDHRAAQEKDRQAAASAWAGTGAVFATALGGWTHPANMERGVKLLVDWSDPARLEQQNGKRSVWQGVAREKRAALMAAVQGGDRLPSISPHGLRHTFATLALRRGVPMEVVSKVLGHARVSITLDAYQHVMDNERRALVVDLFDAPPAAPAFSLPALN